MTTTSCSTNRTATIVGGSHKRRIVISGGTVTGFADEVNFSGLVVTDYDKQRVSRVLPVGRWQRACFMLIRGLVPDDSRAASWTRRWTCKWVVLIDKRTHGPFDSRAAAILFEKDFIYRQGKLNNFVALEGAINSGK